MGIISVTATLLGVKLVQAVWREREELLIEHFWEVSGRRTIAFFMLVESTIELFHLVATWVVDRAQKKGKFAIIVII